MATSKGFIKDQNGNIYLPITRGELLLDSKGQMALFSDEFVATSEHAGLMTAAEKAMLSGGIEGNSLSDVYTKLGHINSGIQVGTTKFHFYKSADGSADPFTIAQGGGIVLTPNADTNTLTIGLETLTAKAISNTIIRNITVDTYGRVTAVSGSNLTNADIPETLEGKKLKGCTVTADGTTDDSLVSKKYVDDAVSGATSIATGALVFAGTISTSQEAVNALIASNENKYYKINTAFELEDSYFSDAKDNAPKRKLKVGDTLIVKTISNSGTKYVHIPSGDEKETTITVKEGSTTKLENAIGSVSLTFSGVLSVLGGNNSATISVKQASSTQDGYLSHEDYAKFAGYESSLSVAYDPTVTDQTTGKYVIGKLTIGTAEKTIYGVNNISALTLENGTTTGNTTINPRLKFTETGQDAKYITLNNGGGIIVKKDGDTINFQADNTVAQGSSAYLSISNGSDGSTSGHIFSLKMGDTTTNGLANTEFVVNTIKSYSATFEVVTDKLGTEVTSSNTNTIYAYGSAKLISAIDVEI